MATQDPRSAGCPVASWSLDDLARRIVNEAHHRELSRATIWRILEEADLKPHKSHYWLNTHAADFADRVRDVCGLYLDAARLWDEERELVVCVDEKTGVCIRQRKCPTQQTRPGVPRRVEHQYFRRGMTQLTASFVVPTGRVSYSLAQTHNSLDFVAHLRHAVAELPAASRYHWVLDNNRSHATPASGVRGDSTAARAGFGGFGLIDGREEKGVPVRQGAEARVPLHAGAWLVAEPGGVVVRGVEQAILEAGRLQVEGGVL
jgi:hypothetical protein